VLLFVGAAAAVFVRLVDANALEADVKLFVRSFSNGFIMYYHECEQQVSTCNDEKIRKYKSIIRFVNES
jgi:hypothetical protein